jgi:hypothetical protein
MIDKGVPPRDSWPNGLLRKLREWEQGDVVANPPLFYFADPSAAIWEATRAYTDSSSGPEVILPPDEVLPPYGMVTTQTCDIAEEESSRPVRPWVQIAPVYPVTNWKRKKLEGGKGPRYWLLVPDLPEDGIWVADLRIEVPIEKSWLAGQIRVEGFENETEKRIVGRRLAWLKGRPAFSRELNEIQQSLFDALDGMESAELETHETLLDQLEEVVVQVDSYLAPTSVQLVFLTNVPLADDCRRWLSEWRENSVEEASVTGLTLHALDFRTLTSVTAEEYRRMTVIWQK